MALPSVLEEGQVFLDGRTYRIEGPVQRELATRFAPKTVIGDYTDESNPLVSTATWRSWNSGFGLETIRSPEDFTHSRWSSLYTRLPNHLLLGPRIHSLGSLFGSVTSRYFDFDDNLYIIDDHNIHLYDDVNDSFVVNPVHSLAAPVTDATTGVLNGEQITVVAHGGAADWSSNAGDSTAWQSNPADMRRVSFWRDLLWGADSNDRLYFTNDLAGSWTHVADLPEPIDDVVNLFAGPSGDRGDPEALYLATRRGLWVYDNLNERFRNTGLMLPRANTTAAAWNGSVFFTSEQRVFRFTPGPTNVVDNLTPSVGSDSLVPRADIGHFTESHPGIDGIFFLTSGEKTIHQWDGRSWSSLPADGNGAVIAGSLMGGMFVSTAKGKHRLVFGHLDPFVTNGTIRVNLPVLSADLASQSSLGFMSSGKLVTPWFDGFVSGNDKLAVGIGFEVSIPDSSESLKITYTRDNGDTTGEVITLNEPGYHAMTVPIRDPDGGAVGVQFDRISLGVEMAIDVTDTSHVFHSPDLKRISLNYIKAQPVRWAYSFLVLADAGESASEVRQSIERTFSSRTLVQFSYRDPAKDRVEPKFVTPVSLRSEESTGFEENGRFRIIVTEV